MIKNILLRILRIKQKIIWLLTVLIERCKQKTLDINQPKLKGKIIIFAPHSDDEWIGCSSLMQLKNVDKIICNMNMNGGDDTVTHEKRKMEMYQMAKSCKCSYVDCFNVDEFELTGILDSVKPDYICVPYYIDWHEEHIEVMGIIKNLISELNYRVKVILYQVSCPMPVKEINYIAKMKKSIHKQKWVLFKKCYLTQNNIPTKRFACMERINGKLGNSFAAEVFCIIDSDLWIKKWNLIPSINERNELHNNLNSLRKSRMITERIYADRIGVLQWEEIRETII